MRWIMKRYIEEFEPHYSLEEKQELYDVYNQFKKSVPLEIILALNLVAKKDMDDLRTRIRNKDSFRTPTDAELKKHLLDREYGIGLDNLITTFPKSPQITTERPFGLNGRGLASYLRLMNDGKDDVAEKFQKLYDEEWKRIDRLDIADYRPAAKTIWSLFSIMNMHGARKEDFEKESIPATPNISTMFLGSRGCY